MHKNSSLERIIRTIKDKGQECLNVEWSYDELHRIYLLHKRFEILCKSSPNLEDFDKLSNEEGQAVLAKFDNDRFLLLFLKSYYVFFDIFICRLLRCVFPAPASIRQFSFKKFSREVYLKNFTRFQGLRGSFNRIYPIIIYRHKLIIHHDHERIGGSFSEGSKTLRLLPLNFDLTQKQQKDIQDLKVKYDSKGIRNEENLHKIKDFLFYNIPFDNPNSQWNQDRDLIDNVVEAIGCKSLSITELDKETNSFLRNLADFLQA